MFELVWLGGQGPLARGVKMGTSVRLAEGAKLKGGAAKIACKTRMGKDAAQAAQVRPPIHTPDHTQPCAGTPDWV